MSTILNFFGPRGGPPGEFWTPAKGAVGDSDLNACTWKEVAYSPSLGMFVAVANGGADRVRYSYNGHNWIIPTVQPPDDTAWNTVVWTGAAWVIGGANSTDRSRQCRISIDGENWMTPTTAWLLMDWQTMACTEGTGRVMCHRAWGSVRMERSADHGSSWDQIQVYNNMCTYQLNRAGSYWAFAYDADAQNRILRTANLDGTSFGIVRLWYFSGNPDRRPWSICYGGGYYFVSCLNHNNQGSLIARASNMNTSDLFTLRPELPEAFRRTNYRRMIYCPVSGRLLLVGDNYVDADHHQGMIIDTGLVTPINMNLPVGGWKWICAAPGPKYVAVANSGTRRILVSS